MRRKTVRRSERHVWFVTFGLAAVLGVAIAGLRALPAWARLSLGTVQSFHKISNTQGSFTPTLDNSDQLGSGVDDIGDLDGDGINDLIVGAWKDDDAGTDFGAAYILFMNANFTVKSVQKITNSTGGFTAGAIDSADDFAFGVWGIGDLDNDGVEDVAVSERASDDGGTNRGAFYILFLNTNGTVKAQQDVSDTAGNFSGTFANTDAFGECVIHIPDVNADGIDDLAVCAKQADDGGTDRGAIWVLYMNRNGTVSNFHKIGSGLSGFSSSALDNNDRFGADMTPISDLNGDGIREWVVGATLDDDLGADAGAVYVLYMNASGTVTGQAKISGLSTNFTNALEAGDKFGAQVADAGDLDGDGRSELLVGAWGDDDGGTDAGAVYLVYLDALGGVKRYQKISALSGYSGGNLDLAAGDDFGIILNVISDMNADGLPELAVGAIGDDDGGTDRGAVWLLHLQAVTGTSHDPSVFPSGGSLLINQGEPCTTLPNLTLHLGAQNASQAIIANDEFFVDSSVQSFTGPTQDIPWTLPTGDGPHTVYVVYRSSTQDISSIFSQSITLDTVNNCGQALPETPDDVPTEPTLPTEPSDDVSPSEQPIYQPSPFTGELQLIEAVVPGEYIRGTSGSTVYYVGEDLKRRPFPNAATFLTWQDRFAKVRLVTDATLPQFPMGAPMLPKPGVVFVKIQTDPTVYVITAETTLRAIPNEDVAQALAGSHWSDYVLDIPTYLFDDFSQDNPIHTPDEVQIILEQMKTRTDLQGSGEAQSRLNLMFQSLWQKITTIF